MGHATKQTTIHFCGYYQLGGTMTTCPPAPLTAPRKPRPMGVDVIQMRVHSCSEQSEPTRRFDCTDRKNPEQKASARQVMAEYLKEHNRQEIERAKSAASQLSLIEHTPSAEHRLKAPESLRSSSEQPLFLTPACG